MGRLRDHAATSQRTLSALVAEALEQWLERARRGADVAQRRLEVACEFVFDRLAEAGLSQPYRILVPRAASGHHGRIRHAEGSGR